jgi:hypothetical protein
VKIESILILDAYAQIFINQAFKSPDDDDEPIGAFSFHTSANYIKERDRVNRNKKKIFEHQYKDF